MLSSFTVKIDCFACYIVDGKYFTILTRGNAAGMGRNVINEVPIDSEEFNGTSPIDTVAQYSNMAVDWKRLKTQHFLQENNPFYGYIERPTNRFPTRKAYRVQWIYVFDPDNNTFSVAVPYHIRRIFHLQHTPRSLFGPEASPNGEISEMQKYRVLLHPVLRAHLASISVPVEPNTTLVDLYQSCSPHIQPLLSIPDAATFPIRKYLRLHLSRISSNRQQGVLEWIHTGEQARPHYSTSMTEPVSLLEVRFRQMVYGMVHLSSSSVEVQFKAARHYNSTAEWQCLRNRDQDKPLQWPVPDAEYWISNILVIPEMNMATAENLHGAIGKAIQVTNARYPQPTISSGAPPQFVCAVIISASCHVVVDVCGSSVTHTPNMPLNMPLNTRYHRGSSGGRVLLDIMYTPVPRPLPTSLPTLPVELCQMIYCYTEKYDKPRPGMSRRLFRGIAYDYGPVIFEWSLQGLCRTSEGSIFTAAVDSGTHISGGKVRLVPAHRASVYLTTEHTFFARSIALF
ncbi:hypothetical protein Q9L58_001955 [Maublancomyces gigas]|uniref:Uncharacterized protein n=1 Tax=Discina gigas TaxID=1032678 RepID=A0ABR3GT20_9PEZI